MKPIVTFIIILFVTSLSAQNRLYVKADAMGANNGQSWINAFQELSLALNEAQPGDSIWVAEGFYVPTNGTNRTISFVQKSGVRLYGGFAGTEAQLSERDWLTHTSLLSGDIGVLGDSTDNSYTILYMENPDSMTVLDGFSFRHGIANYAPTNQPAVSAYKSGGAIYMMGADGWAYALVQNCRFENNYAYSYGGAVYVNGSGIGSVAPQFINCTFEHNHSRLDGGALYRNGGSWAERSPDFGGCLFQNNVAERRGGGLCYNESERTDWIELQGCTFLNNHSNLTGGGANFNVGRVTGSKIAMKGCQFKGNGNDINTFQGEAIALASVNGLAMGSLIIDSCYSEDNDPGDVFWLDVFGGEFIMKKSKMICSVNKQLCNSANFTSSTISQCFFYFGINPSGLTLGRNAIFDRNKVVCESNSQILSFTTGNVIGKVLNNIFEQRNNLNTTFSTSNNDQVRFVGNTIIGSKWLIIASSSKKIEFTNCILKDWTGLIITAGSSPISFDHCSFDNNSFCQSPPSNVTCGAGNLFNLDPLFRDTANGDFSLLPCSPLINAGSNAAVLGILTDIAGNPRIQDGTVDIGAYESPGFALAAAPQVQPACVGATNGSITVNPVFGCEPYTYNWLPVAGTGPELNNLPPGNYLLTITDGSGRQILDTLEVAEAPKPQLNPFSTDVQCANGLGGSISAGASAGTAPYHYQWQPLAADTSMLNHLSPGAYALTVVDAHGCQDSAKASIALLGMLTPSIDGKSISCPGAADGWLSLTPSTGAAPFTWIWTGWAGKDSVAQPLGPGQYSVTVTDAYGCTASNTFPFMNDPAVIVATLNVIDQTNLITPNGAAIVTSTSGGSPFPGMPPYYQYDWSTGEMGTSIAGLSAGTYTITVTDSHGCTSVQAFEVQLMVGTGEAFGAAFLLYPNPAVDWLRLVLPAHSGKYQVELSDASGRVVRSQALAAAAVECQLDLRGFPGGSYWVRVQDVAGNSVFVGKLVRR